MLKKLSRIAKASLLGLAIFTVGNTMTQQKADALLDWNFFGSTNTSTSTTNNVSTTIKNSYNRGILPPPSGMAMGGNSGGGPMAVNPYYGASGPANMLRYDVGSGGVNNPYGPGSYGGIVNPYYNGSNGLNNSYFLPPSYGGGMVAPSGSSGVGNGTTYRSYSSDTNATCSNIYVTPQGIQGYGYTYGYGQGYRTIY